MTEDIRVCPVCGGTEWYDDYPAPDARFSYCERCNWPPPVPMSPKEWREHPKNRMNRPLPTSDA